MPAAKIKGDKRYSIVTDYLGTPIQIYDEQSEKTCDCTLDVYGKVANFEGSSLKDVTYRYQGQYEDEETGLYYNRYRYYSPETGSYLSQDPIRLAGNNPTLYAYVHGPNSELDIFGLKSNSQILGENLGSGDIGHDAHHLVLAGITKDERITALQKKMKDFNIDINGKENGIWLPRNESFRIDNRTLHKGEGVHSDSYKQYTYDKLIQAKDRKDFLAKLQVAKNELENGKKFKCKT